MHTRVLPVMENPCNESIKSSFLYIKENNTYTTLTLSASDDVTYLNIKNTIKETSRNNINVLIH